MNLVFLDASEVDSSRHATLSDARATHLIRVLGVTPGRQVRLGLIDGPVGIGTVTSAGNGAVTMSCAFERDTPPRARVDILLALPRPKVMRRLWAQLAALGIGQIILTNAERVERNYFDTHVLTEDAYRPLLVEGLQQARDTRLPCVSIHREFRVPVEDDLDTLFGDGLRLVADPSASARIAEVIQARPPSRVLMAIGPEGGWNAFELGLLREHGFDAVGMGPRTLRTDTACVALLALTHEAVDDTR